jgi:hypothetical protein
LFAVFAEGGLEGFEGLGPAFEADEGEAEVEVDEGGVEEVAEGEVVGEGLFEVAALESDVGAEESGVHVGGVLSEECVEEGLGFGELLGAREGVGVSSPGVVCAAGVAESVVGLGEEAGPAGDGVPVAVALGAGEEEGEGLEAEVVAVGGEQLDGAEEEGLGVGAAEAVLEVPAAKGEEGVGALGVLAEGEQVEVEGVVVASLQAGQLGAGEGVGWRLGARRGGEEEEGEEEEEGCGGWPQGCALRGWVWGAGVWNAGGGWDIALGREA